MRFGRKPKPLPEGTVIDEVTEGKRVIQKVIYNGKPTCMCPFLCLATMERCAFDKQPKVDAPKPAKASEIQGGTNS